MTLPLEGVRVIEVGQALAGPLAGVLMADMGADVIKIEKPDGGDDARIWGPPFGPDGVTSLYFYSQNRNKRSVALDLKSAADIDKLHRLCETADILIQNLRPGVVDDIGIGPEAMLKRHPRLIYCSIWAFGYQGPLKMKPGFDPLLQAYGGMMSVTGRAEDPPTFAAPRSTTRRPACSAPSARWRRFACATRRARVAWSTPRCSIRRSIGSRGRSTITLRAAPSRSATAPAAR